MLSKTCCRAVQDEVDNDNDPSIIAGEELEDVDTSTRNKTRLNLLNFLGFTLASLLSLTVHIYNVKCGGLTALHLSNTYCT